VQPSSARAVRMRSPIVMHFLAVDVLSGPLPLFKRYTQTFAVPSEFRAYLAAGISLSLSITFLSSCTPTQRGTKRYTDFRCKAHNVFRTDIKSIEYCANGHDSEVQTLQADNAREYEKLGRLVCFFSNTAPTLSLQTLTHKSKMAWQSAACAQHGESPFTSP